MLLSSKAVQLKSEVLIRHRRAKGLSQLKFATKAGVSLSSVSLGERGAFVSEAMATKLARELGVPLAEIVAVRGAR